MKKTTKLLSVLLAVVMMLSCFTMASYAAIANTKTSAGLQSLGAYSPDGAVTRLSTEERMSILFDWLDKVLYNVNFDGIDVEGSVPILGSYALHVHIKSVDQICESVDSLYDLLNSTVGGAATTLNLLGDLSDISVKNYWTKGTRRANKDQLNIVGQLLNVINGNVNIFENILAKGSISLGSIVGGQVNLSSVNVILSDLPGLILSKLYPLMSRKDDTVSVANSYFKGEGNPSTVLNTFVNGLFSKAQSTTTYKEDANGNCISGHTLPLVNSQSALPNPKTATGSNRYYYVKTAASGTTPAYFTCYVYDPESQAYKAEDAKFYREEEGAGTGVYTYKTEAGDGLKYYKNGSYWLPSFVGQTINVNSQSAATLLYKFAPYVFKDLAPIALNGWAKEALAKWMGATETKIYEGKAGTAEATAIANALPTAAKTMFTAAVPPYQFSYSNYEAMNNGDTQYYRYVDKDTNTEEWFELDMTTGNYYLGLFDFTYQVEGTFMDSFVPSSGTGTATILQNLNKFLCKAAKKVLKSDAYSSLGLNDTGDNTNIVPNLRKVIQILLPESPEAILGPDYLLHYDGYYQTLVNASASNDEVLSALAAIIAKALMPQLILPSAANLAGQKVGAVLACVVRELVTQFVPTYNYDALIFTNYNTRTLVSGKDNSYWLDVILTMGVDVGMTYLDNLADLGRDITSGTNKGYQVAASKTYSLSTFESNPQAWEDNVDWIIDWALTSSVEWGWNMEKLINTSSFTVNLATAQDPWVKLDTILNDLLPLKQIINCKAASGKTWLETVLRDKLILGIADLKFEYIVGKGTDYTATGNAGLLSIPSNSILRTSGLVPALWQVVRDLLNKVIYKVAGNANILDTSVFTGIDTLVGRSSFKPGSTTYSNCPNIVRPISFLLRKLPSAYTNVFAVVLPILEMFVGWKTGSQEYSDPEVTWASPCIFRDSSTNNGTELTITNASAGMLLKNYKADGTYSYEAAYQIEIVSVTGSGVTATKSEGNTTVDPYGRVKYTVKANSVPSADTGVQITIKYKVKGKTGAYIGGERYLTTFSVLTKNSSNILQEPYKNDYNKSSGGTNSVDYLKQDAEISVNGLCLSADELENYLANGGIYYKSINTSDTYSYTFSSMTFAVGNTVVFKKSQEATDAPSATVAAGKTLTVHPIALKDGQTLATGANYAIGTIKWQATSNGCTNGPSDPVDMGKLYFADAGELKELFNTEMGMNRLSSEYNTTSVYNAYVTAMNNAAVLINAPAVTSTFATVYTASNITNKTNALKTAIENLEADKKDAVSQASVLEAGLAAGEAGAAIGADGQINFQDYKLYGYWLYEKNRTQARDILKEYEEPTAPEQYIEGCWLPYTDNSKHEDLTTVLANATTVKADAIRGSLKDPAEKDMVAYYQAASEWRMPGYSALYIADIAQKLDYYNDFLIDRAYSKVAAGRVQLAQEIAYAQAQNYVQADYTAVSWARYADALAAAQAANTNGTMQSFVFQAKYDLLVAQRQLRLASHDYATQVGFTDLQAKIDLAEGMFANSTYFTAVDGTLDTEWTDLIEALGYVANFGTGNDAWSMNLYEKSATQLVSEELYYPSVRNDQRVAQATEALQAAIDALKCTIEVIKNDTTTNVDQTVKFITNLTPGTLAIANDVLAHVKASAPAATLAVTATANGFGTGTVVAATLNSIPLANYYVVIYGDINGDNFIDGFDAVKADRKLAAGTTFSAPVEAAADATKDSNFDVNDVGAIINAAAGLSDISQA